MTISHNHMMSACASCRHIDTDCRPSFELIKKLRAAFRAADYASTDDFETSGVACMAGCDSPCTVACNGSRKALYMFGGIDPDTDVADLVIFAQQYAHLHDDWYSSVDRPKKLRTSTRAPVSAAIIVVQASDVCAS